VWVLSALLVSGACETISSGNDSRQSGLVIRLLLVLSGGTRCRWGSGRSVLASLANLGTVSVEDERNGRKHNGDAAEKGGSILDSHTVEHLASKERETSTAERSKECVACDGRSGEHEVRVDEVVESLEEDRHEAETGEEATQSGNNPVDIVSESSPDTS
jgi:hypothetical protein